MLTQDVDVLIIGGGPAGAASGITLLQCPELKVAIVEAGDYESTRVGESLSPGTRPLLEYLKVWDDFQAQQSLQSYGSKAAWGSDQVHSLDFLFTAQGHGWHLDRSKFDRMLAASFQKRGGEVYPRCRFTRAERKQNQWLVHVIDEGEGPNQFLCRYVIDATGRGARFAHHQGARKQYHDHLSAVVRYGHIDAKPSAELGLESFVFVASCDYGWWYYAPLPGQQLALMLMSDSDIISQRQLHLPSSWQQHYEAMPAICEPLAQVQWQQHSRVVPAYSSSLNQYSGEAWVACGDAAVSFDPLSSSGIPNALASGIQAAIVAANHVLVNEDTSSAYAAALSQDVQQYLNTHQQYYATEKRWPDQVFWQRRQGRVSLDPEACFSHPQLEQRIEQASSVHLMSGMLAGLKRECREGRPMHEVVRAFKAKHDSVPDQKIILALQDLMQGSAV